MYKDLELKETSKISHEYIMKDGHAHGGMLKAAQKKLDIIRDTLINTLKVCVFFLMFNSIINIVIVFWKLAQSWL